MLGLDWSGLVVRIDVDDETIMLNDAKEVGIGWAAFVVGGCVAYTLGLG